MSKILKGRAKKGQEYLNNSSQDFLKFFNNRGVIREEDEFPKEVILDLKFEILDILQDKLRNEGNKTIEKVTEVLTNLGFDKNLIYGPQGEMVFAEFMKEKVEHTF